MACSGKSDCNSCVAARNGFYKCEWVMDWEPNFCHNWYDCIECYHDTAVVDSSCPTDASSNAATGIGVVIGVVVTLCICIGIAVIYQQRARRTRTRDNNTNVSLLLNPTPQPQPVPQSQPQPIQQQAYTQQTGVQLQPQPQIINVQAPMNQPVRNDAPPAYEDVDAQPPAYTSQ